MCGIAGAITPNAAFYISELLPKMEYRGYDSWGMAVLDENGNMVVKKMLGGPSKGFPWLNLSDYLGATALGHTRWATQGEVSEKNAHPHSGCDPYEFLGVHNGVLENYDALFAELVVKGHKIHSETDSELILHLIEDERAQHPELPFEKLVAVALRRVEGAFGFACINRSEPGKLVVACNSSPVNIGILPVGGYIVASDKSALKRYTDDYVTLADNHVGVLTLKGDHYFDLQLNIVPRTPIQKLEDSEDEARKDGFPHFMLKELFETGEAVRKAIQGRTIYSSGSARLGGIEQHLKKIRQAQRIVIVASGTSEHAGLIGKYLLQHLAGIPTVVEDASEFIYAHYPLRKTDVVIFVSQSGETADVFRAAEIVKAQGIHVVGIVNEVGSKIAKLMDNCGVYLRIGPEIGVASTKAFIGQVSVFLLLALLLGRAKRKITKKEGQRIIESLNRIPDQLEEIISRSDEIKDLAERYTMDYKDFCFFGRGLSSIVSQEAALKLMEVTRRLVLGIAAGKMKHGPIAVIKDANAEDPEKRGFPVCFVAPHEGDPEHDEIYKKTLTNIREARTRKAKILAIATRGNHGIRQWVDDVYFIPETHKLLTPLLSSVVAMFFAYYAAVAMKLDPDQPENLAKSVTVE